LLAELKRATGLLERTLLMANHTHDRDALRYADHSFG
jgi:hypothetical protein